jgi:hypothetical protein
MTALFKEPKKKPYRLACQFGLPEFDEFGRRKKNSIYCKQVGKSISPGCRCPGCILYKPQIEPAAAGRQIIQGGLL